MTATLDVADPKPAFPEDIERAINDALLNDARDMCGTMSLVASRFYAWCVTKAFSSDTSNDPGKQDETLHFPNCHRPQAQELDEANQRSFAPERQLHSHPGD
jgi:hypothetical protein